VSACGAPLHGSSPGNESRALGTDNQQGIAWLTEILYAYSSSFANNGQAFAGLNANMVFYNFTTAVAMMIGRFGLAIPALALAGLVAQQIQKREVGNAVPTDGPCSLVC